MSKVASAAAAMGVGEDQLAAQLSTIISVTRQAPESVGTALRTVYARISDIKAGIDEDGVDLGRYSGKMAELGFNVLDVAGNLRDMGEVMEEIGGKWADLTREQQINLAQTMAGQRQYSNLIALFDNFDKYTDALNTAQNAAGTLQKQQSTYLEGTAAHLNKLKAAVQNLYDSLINTDSLEPIIDFFTKLTNGVAYFVDAIGGGGALLASLGSIAVTVFNKQIAQGIQTTINNLQMAKQQTQEFKNMIAQAQSMKASGQGNEYTQFLIGESSSLLGMAGLLSPDLYNAIQNQLTQLSSTSGDLEIVNERIGNLKQSFDMLGLDLDQQIKQWGSLDEMLKSADGVEIIKAKLQQLKNSYNPVLNKQKEVTEAFRGMYKNIKSQTPVFEQSFNTMKSSLQTFIGTLKTATTEKGGITLFNSLPENAKKSIEQANLELKNLDFSSFANNQQAANAITVIFSNINQTINNEIKKIDQLMNDASKGQLEKLEAKRKQLETLLRQTEQGYNQLKKKAESTVSIQSVTKLAGAFAQMATSVNQIKNIGSIIANKDIDNLEKTGQILTNIAGTLPSIIYMASSVGSVLGGPWGIVAAAITVAVGALSTYIEYQKAANKAAIEANNVRIEEQHKNQEQIDKKQELLIAVKDLNKEYENGQTTRAQLRNEIEKLIDQYGIEQEYIDQLIDRYGSLTEGIRQARIEEAKRKQESFNTEFKKAKENVEKVKLKDTYSSLFIDYANSSFANTLSTYGASFANPEYLPNGGMLAGYLNLPTDVENRINLYNALSAELQKNQKDPLYNILKTWHDDFSASAEEYNKIKSSIESYLDYDILSNQYADFDKTKTYEEYEKQRQQLIEDVAKQDGNNIGQVTKAVDKYLKQNYKGLYNQYDETLKYIDKLQKRFKGTIDSVTKDSLKALDEAHLNLLQDWDAEGLVTDWDKLNQIITKVSQIDLSNISNVSEFTVGSNEAATDIYTFFNSLKNQVKSGKSISSKEINDRLPQYGASQLKQYFTMMANGQYQMTGDAKQFYEVVTSFELSGFFDRMNSLIKEAERLSNFEQYLQKFDQINEYGDKVNFFSWDYLIKTKSYDAKEKDISSDFLSKYHIESEYDQNSEIQKIYKINNQLAQSRLDYLKAVAGEDQQLLLKIEKWQNKLNDQTIGLTKDDADDIADAIKEAGDQTQSWNEDIVNTKEQLIQIQHRIYDALFPPDADIDESALFQMTQTIQELSKSSEQLSDQLAENARTANQIAEAILRFDNAIQDVVDNYDNWLLALSQENIALGDKAILLPQLRDAYADMLDIDGSLLTEEFLLSTQNLEWMKAAIDGDIEAYNNLAQAARQASLETLRLDPTINMTVFDEALESLQNRLENFSDFSNIEIGAEINDQAFLTQLSEMLNKMNVTAAQASDILRENLGIDTQIIQVKDEATETQEYPKTTAVVTPVDADGYVDIPVGTKGGIRPQRIPLHQRVWSTSYQPSTESITTKKEGSGFALKVTSANKSAGGSFKFSNASRGAGAAGVARRTAAAQKANKSSTAKPATKQTKDFAQDNRDLYHDVNIELSQIARSLNRIQKQQQRLYGKQLIANLNKQTQILEQHKAKLKEKLALQKQDLDNQKQNLKSLGATFDEAGHISNYMDLLGGSQGAVNGAIVSYNSLVNQFNAMQTKEEQEALQDQLTASEEQVKDIQNAHKKLEKAIKDYDSLRDDIEGVVDQIEEETQKQIEIQITKFRMQVEISLQMGEAKRDWNKFKREVLEDANNILNDSAFDTLMKDARLNLNNIVSYFDIDDTQGSIQTLTTKLNATRDQLEDLNNLGEASIYSDRKAQLMEHLQSDLSTLQGQMEDIQGLIENIDQAVLDTSDDIKNQFEEQIDEYEFVNELLEHDIDLLGLLYSGPNYDAMDTYYEKMRHNQLLQVDSLRQQAEYWKTLWENAEDENLAKDFKQKYEDTLKELDAAVAELAQTTKNQYINAINQIFDVLDRKMTGGFGTDYVQMEWQLMKKNADEYLDTINSAFAVQELELKYRKIINDTSNVKNQKTLTNLLDEQLTNLREKEKLTQYDVDRAQKLLQIEQARLALEDSKKNKTSLRLRRDSQGNYSYEYAADEEDLLSAQEDLLKAQNDLYNFDKQAYRSNLEDMLAAWRDFRAEYQKILLDDEISEADKIERLKVLQEQYGIYINNKTAENLVIRNNLMDSAFADYAQLYEGDYESFKAMADAEKEKLMSDLVPQWKSGVQQMTDAFVAEGGFLPSCQDAFSKLETATDIYKEKIHELEVSAGEDFNQLKEGIDETAKAFQELIIQNDVLIDKMGEQMNSIKELRNELNILLGVYKDVWKAAQDAADAADKALQKEYQKAYNEAKNNADQKIEPIEPGPVGNTSSIGQTEMATAVAASGSGTNSGTGSGKKENPWSSNEFSATAKGIAGNIYYNGSWANVDLATGINKMYADRDPKSAAKLLEQVQILINGNDKYQAHYKPPAYNDPEYYKETFDYYEMVKKYRKGTKTSGVDALDKPSFDTGGYTGSWGSEGRLAWLHQKELVLNADDTRNMLDSVSILRNIVQKIGGSVNSRLSNLNSGFNNNINNNADSLEQNVTISASFPNVNSKKEIEEAFNDLVNLAAQRALRR